MRNGNVVHIWRVANKGWRFPRFVFSNINVVFVQLRDSRHPRYNYFLNLQRHHHPTLNLDSISKNSPSRLVTRQKRIMRHLRQEIMQRVGDMPRIQPKILAHLIRTAPILIAHTRQPQPVLRIIGTDGVQLLEPPGLHEAVFVVQHVREQRVEVDVPDDGVAVLVGEGGGHGAEAGVVVGHLAAFGGAHVAEFGGAVEGREAVEDEVAGAGGVELGGGVSVCGGVRLLYGLDLLDR